MRSRSTNILQGVVILTGVVYIVMGVFFFISPYTGFKLFSVISEGKDTAAVQDFDSRSTKNVDVGKITEDDWLHQINHDDIMSPLYYVFRIFSALVFLSGAAMVMPLFDPLRYRGLIYYNGLMYPFVSTVSLVIFIFIQKSINIKIAADLDLGPTVREAVAKQEAPVILIILTAIFTVIFILTAAGLIITRKEARAGRE
jgi:preprotein translocase subunit SecG